MQYFKSARFDLGLVLVLAGAKTLPFATGKMHTVPRPENGMFQVSYSDYDLRPAASIIAGSALAGAAIWRIRSN